LSRFPLHFDDKYQEEKYGNFVKINDYYLISVITDGMHQNIKYSEYKTNIKLIENKLNNVILLDSFLTIKDIIMGLMFSLKFQYYRIILKNKSYKFKDFDVSEFILLELTQSCIRIPRLLMYHRAIKTVFNKYSINKFIYYLHEYCYGRYFTYMLKTFFPLVSTIGFQHGPASRRKLLYHLGANEADQGKKNYLNHLPIPDKVLAEDPISAKIYIDAGYINVSVMKEIYRLNYLKNITRKNIKLNTILVALGLHDGKSIMNQLFKEIIQNARTKYIIKLHPLSAENKSIINMVKQINAINLEIGKHKISFYFAFVSEVIVSYSSVGLEAYFLGIPVRLLDLPNKINESPLLDVKGFHSGQNNI